MIDNFAIYSTCLVLIYIIWRAALLDNLHPWFRPFREDETPPVATESRAPRPVWRR